MILFFLLFLVNHAFNFLFADRFWSNLLPNIKLEWFGHCDAIAALSTIFVPSIVSSTQPRRHRLHTYGLKPSAVACTLL